MRFEAEQPHFFRSAKVQCDRGNLPCRAIFYMGELVEAIQREPLILHEIAKDYRKYIKTTNGNGNDIEGRPRKGCR